MKNNHTAGYFLYIMAYYSRENFTTESFVFNMI